MPRVRALPLILFSLAWVAYIFSNSVDSFYNFNFQMILKEMDQRYVIENAAVPIIYMWMFFIFLKILTSARYKPNR